MTELQIVSTSCKYMSLCFPFISCPSNGRGIRDSLNSSLRSSSNNRSSIFRIPQLGKRLTARSTLSLLFTASSRSLGDICEDAGR